MPKLNCYVLLVVLCTLFITDIFGSPIHEKSFAVRDHGGLQKDHHKRSINGTQDWPSRLNADDPQIKLYAQEAIDKLTNSSVGISDAVLEKIQDAIFFPPPGRLLYDFMIDVRSKHLKYNTTQCTVNVWRESDAEPSVTIECDETVLARRRRAVQPQIADLPSKSSVDDSQVKLYAQKGIKKLAEASTGPSDLVLEKILEATFFPPAGKLLYEIKIKVGSKQNKNENQECKVNVWRESDAEPSVTIECDETVLARRRRAVQPQIADLPSKSSVDDSQVKLYAQKGIKKLAEASTGPSDLVLEKILEATFFPPAGKLLYEIKIKVGSKQNKNENQECKVNVWRESDAEPSVAIECSKTEKKKRETDEIQPQIADLTTKLSVDDPEVKKYAQEAVDQFGSSFAADKKTIVKEIEEATSYASAGKFLYKIKFQMGTTNCTKGNNEPKCEYNPEAGYEDCEVKVFKVTDKEPSMIIECSRIGRRRRDAEETQTQIEDLPTDLKIDDPVVKKYAQMAVDKLGGHSSGMKGIVREIVEAKSYPPSGKLLYTVKFKVGSTKCPKESDEKNCEYDPEAGDDNCEINVYKETDEDSTGVKCWRVDRRRRDVDGVPPTANLPSKPSVYDPQVKLYAQTGIEKLSQTTTGSSDTILEKVLEAILSSTQLVNSSMRSKSK